MCAPPAAAKAVAKCDYAVEVDNLDVAYGSVQVTLVTNSGGPLQPEDNYGCDRGGTPSSNQDDWLHEPMPTYAERTRKVPHKSTWPRKGNACARSAEFVMIFFMLFTPGGPLALTQQLMAGFSWLLRR